MKILATDDHALIREGLHAILRGAYPDLVFIEACDGASARQRLAEHRDIELVLLDVRMPDCDGIELMCQLHAQYPTLPVVMLSAESDVETVRRAIDNGAAGFLPKTSLNQILVSAINLVMAGGVYIPPEAMRRPPLHVLQSAPSTVKTSTAITPSAPAGEPIVPSMHALGLTDRQADVLAHLLEGKSNKQICRELDLAEATVKVHVRAILRVLGVNSRTEAMVAASRLGFNIASSSVSDE